ncbi:hypothetical protein JR316_0003190 [Psilocybe cubensis]|uniref:Uncharacterized protein n=2 Tax=Psilocybe cubensis TaxID=181762 RepID=A0A8H8CNI4_PSICU|nr:hypothetical protein JR316_0003190 [Psilocybe cubensis]KAH9483714.1 hypothetical protein JR316_0003190 [Psilocybe cubensis]
MLSLLAVGFLGLWVQYSQAQSTAKCLPGFDWSFNSLGQSPCDVAAALGGVCIGTSFQLGALSPGLIYLGPTPAQANSCRCSSVYYSLLSACSVCQDANFLKWSTYKTNCTVVYSQVFAQPIPSGVNVPHYAYLDVETADTFNPSLAQAAGGPESTSVPQSTSATSATSGPTPTNIQPPTENSGKKSNAGAIAGGVVGGLVGIALLAGLVYLLLRRKKRQSPPSSVHEPVMASQGPLSSQNPMSLTGSSYPSTPAPKVYDPNDPSTFPSDLPQGGAFSHSYNPSSPFIPSVEQTSQPYPTHISPNFTSNSAQNSIAPPSRTQYTGAPEL